MSFLFHFLFLQAFGHKVFLMRHCVRSPLSYDRICAAENFTHFSDYAAKPLPTFDSPPGHCTPRGINIIANQGRFLASNGIVDDNEQLRFIVDDAVRDNTTATHLISGLDAWNRSTFHVHGEVWSPEAFFQKCTDLLPAAEVLVDNLNENVKKMNPPDPTLYEKLQAVLGKGKAPPLSEIKTWIRVGSGSKTESSYRPKLCGDVNLGHEFSSVFMLEWGDNLEVAWDSPNFQMPDDIYNLYPLALYAQRVSLEPTLLSIRYSNLVANIVNAVKGNTTTFFVGHDTDLHAISLWMDLFWKGPGEYGKYSTPPGAMLMLDVVEKDIVELHLLATTFDTDTGKLVATPVVFPDGKNSIKIADLEKVSKTLLRDDCVSNVVEE